MALIQEAPRQRKAKEMGLGIHQGKACVLQYTPMLFCA